MFSGKLADMLGIKYPVIQGGMAWISEASLASAVSEAGGLGVIAAGNAPASVVLAEIEKARKKTEKPLGVNVMLLSPFADEVAKMVADAPVDVIITGAGNPDLYVDMWKRTGKKVIPVVPSTALAKRMEKMGADAIIAEGCEAGGHIGELTTMTLIPQVADEVNIPLIAAGGIGDRRGVLAAWMLGACGVQVGTRFLLAEECIVHKNYKEQVIKAKDIDTMVTGRSTGHPVRVLKNKLAREFSRLEKAGVTSVEQFDELGRGALQRAVQEGDVKLGSLMAGQIAGLLSKEEPAEEIVKDLYLGAKELFLSLAKEIR